MIRNESSKSSLPEGESKQTSNQANTSRRSRNQIICELVKDWHTNFQTDKKDPDTCYDSFICNLSKQLKMKIKFDNSVSQILVNLSKQQQFLQFHNNKENQLKKTLKMINQMLRQKKFISQRQYNKFKTYFLSTNLEDSIYLLKKNLEDEGVLIRRKQNQPHKRQEKKRPTQEQTQKLLSIWQISMLVSLQAFWRHVLANKVQHREIMIIFRPYYYVIQEMVSKQFKNQIGIYLKSYYEKLKLGKIQPIRQLQTSIFQYDHLLDNKAQIISAYLNKERWQKYQKQYKVLIGLLFDSCTVKTIKFQPYGSFRSKFFIIDYSDIDIGMYYEGQQLKSRDKVCRLLEKIDSILKEGRQCIPNYFWSQKYISDKIKVPFVKVAYKNNFGKNKDIVPSMDIILNNYEGLQNSDMLALYAENEYLLKFCNLIKYWAVRRNLINLQKKIEGLSSYGVLLMCLYYLMVSKQIPFLKKMEGKYCIGEKEFKIQKKLLDNFIDFLKFYSLEYTCRENGMTKVGKFHQQKMIVCLLEKHQGERTYEEGFIVNMYDFIDGSNPGRMRHYLKGKFQMIFSETIECLEQRSISFIKLNYPDQESEVNCQSNNHNTQNKENNEIMYRPRRGNRII